MKINSNVFPRCADARIVVGILSELYRPNQASEKENYDDGVFIDIFRRPKASEDSDETSLWIFPTKLVVRLSRQNVHRNFPTNIRRVFASEISDETLHRNIPTDMLVGIFRSI